MPFRETASLYDYTTSHGKLRLFLSRLNWRQVCIPILALLPFVAWVAIILQGYHSREVQVNAQLLQASEAGDMVDNYQNVFVRQMRVQEKLTFEKQNEDSVKIQTKKKTITKYSFTVTHGDIAPDNFLQSAFLINGNFPGPIIRVPQNASLIVHVTNKLKVPITFHFHGIHQRGTFLSDGVPNVTQEPIPPGGSFIYEMDTWPQAGTFFYHAHTAMDIVWLYGPLIVEDDPLLYKTWPRAYQYDEDRIFILNGVYHQTLDTIIERISGSIHNYPDLISSVTINGKSYGEWGSVTNGTMASTRHSPSGYDVTSVEKGLRYRFRFINAASDSLLSCNISSHTFTVIEMDGIYLEPIKTDHVVLSPGQRYSIVIEMDQVEDNYYISCKHMESSGPRNGLAILNYKGAPRPSVETKRLHRPGSETLILDRWILDQCSPNYELHQTDVYKVPSNVDKQFVIDVFEAVVGERHLYLLNGHYFEEPKVPYYIQVGAGVNITNPPQVFEFTKGQVIQFVLQNQRTDDFCFSHPWHVHGHSFYVVGEGPDRFDPVKDKEMIDNNIKSGKKMQFRDSVTVYANQTYGEENDGAYCGWVAIRFVANNPGIWLAHCHVTPHMIMGKKFVMWEHTEEDPRLSTLL